MTRKSVVFLFVASLLVFYTGLCFSRLFPASPMIGDVLAVGLAILTLVPMRLGHHPAFASGPGRYLYWTACVLLGWWATFGLLAMAADIIRLLLIGLLLMEQPVSFPLTDQAGAISETILIVLATVMSLAGLIQALSAPCVRTVDIPIKGLPTALAGLRIVQISDLHVGPLIRRAQVERVVAMALACQPDLIALTGDLADGSPAELAEDIAPLALLRAPLGVYTVTGNHEYYSGALSWLDAERQLGFIPLLNENRVLHRRGEPFLIAGVTDLTAHRFIAQHRSDPVKAVQTQTPCHVRILLAHQPESCVAAQKAGFNLQLSGHTHAGQFFPFSLLVRAAKRHWRGLDDYCGLWVYVNAGTGFWGTPNRLFTPTEISVLCLRPC
jgi:predicted MPP superfamily phosphohydrolase